MSLSNAIVIGAGIGGLAVAAALTRRGMAVTLLEQSPALGEVGAGLQVSPNGMNVLRAMGLEGAVRDRRAVFAQAVVLSNDRGRQVSRIDLTRHKPDQKYAFMHRADLIDILLAAARRGNVSVELGARVAEVMPGDPPHLRLHDGSTRRADFIIDASGIHSRTREVLNGADAAQFAGQVAWRAVVPNLFDHPPEAHVAMGPGRHLVSYPIRGGKLVNLVAVEEREKWVPEGWNHPDDPAQLRAAFAGFEGRAAQMIAAVDSTTLWGLHIHPVAAIWQRHGVALLGDAAHPTLPFLAQGANMALEDAWVLADCILTLPQDKALAAYQLRRDGRVRRVVKVAQGNARRYHLRPGPKRFLAHLGLRAASTLVPGQMVGTFDWLYGYDVTAVSRRG